MTGDADLEIWSLVEHLAYEMNGDTAANLNAQYGYLIW